MRKSAITTSRITLLQPADSDLDALTPCLLRWRDLQLWIKPASPQQQAANAPLPSLQSRDWLLVCLKRSAVQQVILDAALGADAIGFWAEACAEVGKPAFVRLSPQQRRLAPRPRFPHLISLGDRILAALVLLLLSPLLLGIWLLLKALGVDALQPQWRVAQQGRLFRGYLYFHHSLEAGSAIAGGIGQWLLQSGLYRLPLLWNVLRGELSLLQRRALPLSGLHRRACPEWSLLQRQVDPQLMP